MATGGGDGGLSEETFDVNCTVCIRKQKIRQAQNFCHDCKKNMCADCVKIHNDFNEDHVVVEGHGEDKLEELLTEKCEKHKDELIKLYCKKHDVLACSICGLLEHSTCGELKCITEYAEELCKDPNIQSIPGDLKSALANVDRVINALDQHIEGIQFTENKYIDEIEDLAKRLLAKIEDLKTRTKKDVTSMQRKLVNEAQESLEACQMIKKAINKCVDDMKTTGKRKAHLFILRKKGQVVANKTETLCKDSETLIKNNKLLFHLDLSINNYLNKFKSLGNVIKKYRCSLRGTIDVKVSQDKNTCDVMGCCLLRDGTILLTDYANRKLKRVDPSTNTVIHQYDMNKYLWGITCVSQQEVAVCTGSHNSVEVVSLGSKLTPIRSLQMNHQCWTVVYNKGELFVADNTCLYVYDMSGTLLRQINMMNLSGNGIRGIALSQTGERIYIACLGNGLVCINRAGGELFRLSETQLGLSGTWGVATDELGCVLVCGRSSNNAVQVTEDGSIIGPILSKADGLERPQCMIIDKSRNSLYVGGQKVHLELLTVFDID